MLSINNLHASVDDVAILKGLNLQIEAGQVHAIMGPNGSGKSTLSKVVAGHPSYNVDKGTITFEKNFEQKNLLELEAWQRACEGIFLSFQYPIEIPGVSNFTFLQSSFNQICKYQGSAILSDEEFAQLIQEKIALLKMNPDMLDRFVNANFSGGEKKRNEILQMQVLNPQLAFLDETDSGLDVDSMKIVANGINTFKNSNNAVVLVTHYQRLLDYVTPDFVHVLIDGKIVESGDKSLAIKIEQQGYDWFQ